MSKKQEKNKSLAKYIKSIVKEIKKQEDIKSSQKVEVKFECSLDTEGKVVEIGNNKVSITVTW